jgi:hypothetical protein
MKKSYTCSSMFLLDASCSVLDGVWFNSLQPQGRHLVILSVSSAKSDNIFWNKFEETLFRLLI